MSSEAEPARGSLERPVEVMEAGCGRSLGPCCGRSLKGGGQHPPEHSKQTTSASQHVKVELNSLVPFKKFTHLTFKIETCN